ncbi:autotransporter-associated beta strand repeat-containing protein [Luteolibacter arcticus]|uniref:Autotransporter-associated beta strand repeat-containing protein n=1 Tax=Luteolibacter arcticus TaxID=1581411 RepID=A0ABT3GDV2_9BACT|nr:autotransporter-associated beta strand repeat-containing protein [Luteolibacter arcticus]MCW1921485.1 autotransporter-associated beta strand repeat-containing protein [Luteolibacter arcticus]
MKTAPIGALTRASLLACASLCATAPLHAAKTWTGAADATWANTANWLEVALPGTTEMVNFTASSAANLTIDTGAARTIRGISLTSPSGAVTIQNNSLTIGSGGIDLSTATQDLTLASAVTLPGVTTQNWQVAAGRTISVPGAITRNPGGAVNFSNSSGAGTINIGSGTVSTRLSYATLNGVDVASLDATKNIANSTAVFTYVNPNGGNISGTVVGIDVQTTTAGATQAYRHSNSLTTSNGVRFNAANTQNTSWTVDTSSAGRVNTTPHIIVTSSVGAQDVIYNGAGGLRANSSGGELFLHQLNPSGSLIFNAPINGNGASSLTKTGPGTVIIASAASYSGETRINEGTLQIGNGGTAGSLAGALVNYGTVAINRSDTFTLGGIISGPGPITKLGTGTVVLGGANTYTGATTVTGGLIGVAALGSLGSTPSVTLDGGGIQWTAPVDISSVPILFGVSGATFDSNGLAISLANPVGTGSSGSLSKKGSGSLSLSAANSYLGGTNVNAGVLLATNVSGSATGTGPVVVNTGGTLGGNGNIDGAVTVTAGGTVAPGTSVGTLTVDSLELQPDSALNFEFGSSNDQITVQNAQGLTISGGAITLLQEGSAVPFASAGTYNLIAYSGTLGGAATNLTVANPQPGFTYNFGTAGGFVTLTIGTPGVVRNWIVNGGGSWTDNANWNGTFPNGTSATANFSTNLSNAATVTLDGMKTVGALTFLSGTNGYTISQGSGGSLIFNNGSNGSSVVNGDGVHTISAPITLTTNTVITTSAADDGLTLSGAISGGGSLTKSGPGFLDLLGSNSFNGSLTLSGGITTFANGGLGNGSLSLAGSKLLWGAGNLQDISNRTISFTSGTIEFDIDGNDVTLANSIGNFGTADLIKSGEGKLTLGGDPSFTGIITLAAGTLQFGTGGSTGLFNGGDIVNNGTLAFNLAGPVEFFGNISGTGSLIHQGTGSLGLTGTGSFTGTTTIPGASSSIILLNGTALQGSTLQYDASGGSISFASNGAATLGALEGNKDLVLNNADETPLGVALTVGGNGASTTYSGKLTGLGSFTKNGGGALTLDNDNNYAGATNLSGVTFPAINKLELPPGGKITTAGVNMGTSTLFLVSGGDLTSSAQSTVDNRGFSTVSGFQLASGTAAFNGGIRTSSTSDGCLIWVAGGSFTASNVTLQRTRSYNALAEGPSSTTPAYTEMDAAVVDGFVVSGGTAAVNGPLVIGTSNSGASAHITGGATTVTGEVTIGNTTNTRWSMLQVSGGSFTSTDTVAGIVMSPNATTTNRSMVKLTGGVASVQRIGFGTATAAAGTGVVWLKGGTLYLGAGGMVQDAPAFTSSLHLTTGTLGATADWSTGLATTLDGSIIVKAADAADVPHNIVLSGTVTGTGSLGKQGGGTLTLSGTYSYSGNTTVSAGTLSLGTGTLSDTGIVDVSATGSAVLNLNFAGTDTVAGFSIDGVAQATGTWGSLASSATHKTARITGTGILNVGGAADPFADWIDDFAVGGLTAKTDDPDRDGLTNLEEFAFDGNPANGTATGKVRSRIETVGADKVLVITLPVRNTATFGGSPSKTATVDDIIYTIEGSNNLTLFDQGVTEIAVSAAGMPTPLTDGWTYHTFRLDGAIGGVTPRGPKGFLRVSAADATP